MAIEQLWLVVNKLVYLFVLFDKVEIWDKVLVVNQKQIFFIKGCWVKFFVIEGALELLVDCFDSFHKQIINVFVMQVKR